jgi:class 3 adenylate cyclase/TolB-like protein/Tfp pilus assembly protein PilF
MSETRKLAAILVSDIVGYSRLAGADEDRILARLRTLRSDLIDPTIAVHHGRIIKRTGDGSVIEFRSVVDAVNCAIEVQRAMVERNAEVTPDKRIEFRIGIHLGDVVEESDGDILGDGVNVAARLEGICEPGGLCVSGSAYEHVRGRIEAEFADLGEQTLKNIAQPVRAYGLSPEAVAAAKIATPEPAIEVSTAPPPATKSRGVWARWPALAAALALVLLAAGGYAWRSGYAPRFMAASVDDKLANAPRLSIVVLPFENLSGDKEQDCFSDGITDDLTTDLSHQIGKELGVRYVLEGSVQRSGEKVEVNAQLISTETGAHVWADRFEGERNKLGDLQVEFVSRLANSLRVELVKAEALRTEREQSDNPGSADLAMRGMAVWYGSWSKSSVNGAIVLFERALALDAQNFSALRGLAAALNTRVALNYSEDPASDTARAEKTIDAALALQPNNSSAHESKGFVYAAKRQWPAAIAEFEKAVVLDQNNASAHAAAGFFKMYVGRAEDGIAGVETALRLSPRDPVANLWQFWMCYLYNSLAQWEQAIDWCNKSIVSDAQFWFPYVGLAAAKAAAGHDKEAKDAVAELLKLHPGYTVQDFARSRPIDDPTLNAQYERVGEGLRKAGLPEGVAKTN